MTRFAAGAAAARGDSDGAARGGLEWPAPRWAKRRSILMLGWMPLLAGCFTAAPARVGDLAPLFPTDSAAVQEVLRAPAQYRFQMLLTEVVPRPRRGALELRRYGFRMGAEYFYPASSIKLCAAVAALQIWGRIEAECGGADLLEAPMEIAPLFPGDALQKEDPSNVRSGQITLGHEIRKLALVSDNRAFNRLFDCVGHEALNRAMHELGFASAVLNHRLSETRRIPDPTATAAVTVHLSGGPSIPIPARTSGLELRNRAHGLAIGAAHLRAGERVEAPMDFTRRNGISLVDLQGLLIKVCLPDAALTGKRLELRPAHRACLIDAMTIYPRESVNPVYDAGEHGDAYAKFLLPGIRRVIPSTERGRRIEITGKAGRAYGFSVENAWLRNPANRRSVFVTAVLYTNADGVLNDDRYEYGEVAEPFFADLGEWIARRWLAGAPR